MRALAFAGILSGLLIGHAAWADCENVPAAVAAYLAARPGWKIVHQADLGKDDQALWSQYHGQACPGLARADLQGNGRWSYGLSLINGQNRQIIILYDTGKALREKVLFTLPGGTIEVVHTAAPGPTYEVETHHRIGLQHQSLVFEALESSAEQYYWRNGKLGSVVISE